MFEVFCLFIHFIVLGSDYWLIQNQQRLLIFLFFWRNFATKELKVWAKAFNSVGRVLIVFREWEVRNWAFLWMLLVKREKTKPLLWVNYKKLLKTYKKKILCADSLLGVMNKVFRRNIRQVDAVISPWKWDSLRHQNAFNGHHWGGRSGKCFFHGEGKKKTTQSQLHI